MDTLLENMEILGMVDRALQKMGEFEHSSLSRGKLPSHDTPPSSHELDPSGINGLGEERKLLHI